MIDEDEKALAWFRQFIPSLGYALNESEKHALNIQRMLARPALPEEPTPELLRAIKATRWSHDKSWEEDVYHALYAHLTKPATREVEVWHVEYAGFQTGKPHIEVAETGDEANEKVRRVKKEHATCIRVTGPHKQVIPND